MTCNYADVIRCPVTVLSVNTLDVIKSAINHTATFYQTAPTTAWLALATPLISLLYVYLPEWARQRGYFCTVTNRATGAVLFATATITGHVRGFALRVGRYRVIVGQLSRKSGDAV